MLEHNFPAAFGNSHDQLNDSTSWVHGLPERVMLGYNQDRYLNATRGFSVGEFADGSGAFRAAARRAGKQVDFYVPDSRFATFLEREARMTDAVSRYVYGYYTSSSQVAPRC